MIPQTSIIQASMQPVKYYVFQLDCWRCNEQENQLQMSEKLPPVYKLSFGGKSKQKKWTYKMKI